MDDEQSFVVEDVESVIKTALVNIFADVSYDAERMSGWTNAVLEQVLKGLQLMGKNYKYIISAIITQKNGAGLHTAAGLYWDSNKDGARNGGRPCYAPRRALVCCISRALAQLFAVRRALCCSARALVNLHFDVNTRCALTPFTLPFRRARRPGICKVSWENPTIQVIVTVYGLSLATSPQLAEPPRA